MENLHIFGPVSTCTSYGVVTRNLISAFMELGYYNIFAHNVSPNHISYTQDEEKTVGEALKKGLVYDPKGPCLKVFHADEQRSFVGTGKRIAFPIFELDRLKPEEAHQLRSVDAVVVTSEWAAKVLMDSGVHTPCVVAPLGVDRTIFNEDVQPHPENDIAKDSATKFLLVGKWEVRKGSDIVIKAFEKAFKPSDDVALIANCHNMFIGKEGNDRWASYYKSSKLGDKVFILPNYLPTQQNVAALMASVDCGVFCSRAEGWNLELLECMSMGKEVIATYATAHTEYCTPQNALLVDVGPMEVAQDGVFFHKQGEWPSMGETQIDQIVEHMRSIHKVKQNGWDLFNPDGVETAKKLSWKNTALKISQVIA